MELLHMAHTFTPGPRPKAPPPGLNSLNDDGREQTSSLSAPPVRPDDNAQRVNTSPPAIPVNSSTPDLPTNQGL